MARMLPAFIDPDTASPGEKYLFNRLSRAPGTADWVVLHSINLPRHIRQAEGEVDFVIVAPSLGVLCLEVKAHKRITRDESGMWRLGAGQPTPRSPFAQASDAMHSLRKELVRQAPALTSVPFTSAVAFTHTDWNLLDPAEWHEWQVLDAANLHARPIDVNVRKVLTAARDHYRTAGISWLAHNSEPTPIQVDTLIRKLRPSFELVESRKTVRSRVRNELLRFTQEQYDALDSLATVSRLHFNGPAGTGKTFLAMEAARRAAAAGARVLLACYNRPLARWLQAESVGAGYDVRTFHSFLLELAGHPSPTNSQGWWSTTLPDLALDRLLDVGPTHDVLIVDEAQDLLSGNYLDCMDAAISDGLAAGRWTVFSDLERQALYKGNADIAALKQRAPDLVRFNLHTNCRNTPSVADYTRAVAGLESGYSRILRPDNGWTPRTRFYSGPEQQGQLLAEVFADLRRRRVEPTDVAILCVTRENIAVKTLPPDEPWRNRIDTDGTGKAGWAVARTVYSFKGLEAPIVILTGIEAVTGDEAQAQLYVALSRPTESLFVLAHEKVQPTLQQLIKARILGQAVLP